MQEQVAIFTGAARGIGLAATKLLLSDGVKVVMVNNDHEALKKAAEDVSNAVAITCDVSEPDKVDQVISTTIEQMGRIDCLINNAGVADFGPIEQTSFATWRRVMATKLDGMVSSF